MIKHEVICDRCDRKSNLTLDIEKGTYSIPVGFFKVGMHNAHLCERCYNRAIEKEPKCLEPK